MTDNVNPEAVGSEESDPTDPAAVDERQLDPATGAPRDTAVADQPGADSAAWTAADAAAVAEGVHPDTTLAAERLLDLQRLQAEYVNYKRRVDRDRDVVRDLAVSSVIEAMLPVLDDIHAARQHGDLEGGPFAAIADKLEATLAKFGLERFGAPGEAFDPMVHEALMHTQAELAPGTDVTTIVQVLQPGYKAGERVVRPARVAVADPQ